jgi:hypothetical protein
VGGTRSRGLSLRQRPVSPGVRCLGEGFYKREGLDAELISVRKAVTAVQALNGNQIDFIFSVGC